MTIDSSNTGDSSPDREDRIQDFLQRHGGPAARERRSDKSTGGLQGWTEVYAADGYTLRCDWEVLGGRKEMKYSELPFERSN